MQLRQVKEGDVVQCNVRGRIFEATARHTEPNKLHIIPPAGITYFTVKANQVLKVVKKGSS
jgi:hypothetical protein